MNGTIVIPARRDSKGMPHKNRRLLEYTLSTIPAEWYSRVIISTNDEKISNEVEKKYPQCRIHHRSESSALDTTPTKQCIEEVINDLSIEGTIIMLYLTYPERKWQHIKKIWDWYTEKGAKSLLCREEIDIHPYLCMQEVEGEKGAQIVEHELYRRQDYPPCFKLCHMVSIFDTTELENLNNNLYNKNTVYYKIPRVLDVDTPEDFNQLNKEEHNG